MEIDNKSIDLHGISHERAEILVEDFFYLHEPPFEVITGHSTVMQNIVLNICEQFEYDCFHRNSNNLGSLIIIKGF